jgi:hypothetical protein
VVQLMILRDITKASLVLSSSITALVLVAMVAIAPSISQHLSALAQTSSNQTTSAASTNITAATVTKSQALGSVFDLSRANIPIDIPLSKGYVNGNEVFFITTDASDQKIASQITSTTGFKLNFAPLLSKAPNNAVAQFYVFENGAKGDGTLGFQPNVANAQPGDANYSPIWKVNMVQWKKNGAASSPSQELKSEKQIMDAKDRGDLTVSSTQIYVNCPFLKWNGGSMKIRDDKTITDDSPYVGGQVLKIDTTSNKKSVTMVAHRGFGPDGKTIYYIVADPTPQMPAAIMGVTLASTDEKLISSPTAVDLLQFKNGIKGSGPMGFQAGIGAANPTDSNYSPIWKISFMEWKDPSKARILETLSDITAAQQAEMLTVMPAFEGKHVVNCPFFDPSTIFEHQSKS